MASYEHKQLAQYLKDVHSNLRISAVTLGAKEAWARHCKNKDALLTYAEYMEKLATVFWEENYGNEDSSATSRIQWSVELCNDYFIKKEFVKFSAKDFEISKKLNIQLSHKESFTETLQLLDVGSCYNPFRSYNLFNVLAIDLCPANQYVKECDFLNVHIGKETIVHENIIKELKQKSFDVITFCFLLEYIPSSDLRITACENAYKLLKPGGLLIISTPDSKHVGANCKLMKCWQYTLACLGFSRIRYEKLKHMHCIGFRKALHKDVAVRWATIHKKPFMDFSIHIPQDHSKLEHHNTTIPNIDISPDDFKHLPFSDL
ncbi:S-adenosylmethionine sensor upstream of mTORC1 [Zerene cesonia]|uniref:S-adenosylmethionine sensor upstream of mTORC1 n=1 Tax=Zerene cesonia TaxID=33412 RepID=UPI0018E5646A|nr:S-adenosylmethionine sensor upstream of mTORC1 [Zerene cesonia]